MEFVIDYEHIFFDRFELTEDEKLAQSTDILKRCFKQEEWNPSFEKDRLFIKNCEGEREMKAKKLIKILKKEFFILITPIEDTTIEEKTDTVDSAEKYIRENYLYDTLSPGEVAAFCNVGRKELDTAFNKRFSMSVSEYIRYIRVEKTKNLLTECLAMERIASLCGFGSVRTMQRSFKSVCGKTPGEYRRGQLDSEQTK